MIRAALLAAACALSVPANAAEIRVFATGAVQQATQDIIRSFEQQTGHKVIVSFGTAGGIGKQLANGEAADVVLSSAAGLRDAKARLVDQEPVVVGRVRMGMALKQGAPKPDISTPEKLKAVVSAASAVAYPDPAQGATTGIHFAKVLEQMGILDQVKAKAVLGKDGADVTRAVVEGKAAMGFTQTTEIQGVPGAEVAGFLPDAYQLVSAYAISLTKEGDKSEAARAFYAAFTSPKGVETFARFGFEVK